MRHAPSHELTLLQGSQAYFPALVQAMADAQHEILFETYIFDFSASSLAVAQALAQAAARGVQVRVVLDGLGTRVLPTEWAKRWRAAGVEWRIFEPLGAGGVWFPSRWRRLHRKLCVVDQTLAFCGGINVLDDFHDPHGRQALQHPRLDFAVQCRGPLVQAVHATMTQLWGRMAMAQALRSQQLTAALDLFRETESVTLPDARGRYRLVLRDNVRHRADIQRSYLQAIGRARHEILIANAFFFPAPKLRRALARAAQRGVRVRLLLQGYYEYAVPYRAARQVYGQLLGQGIEIMEYQASYLHAKVAVIDGRWATVGSSNLDPLSLLLAREANVVVQDAAFARSLQARLEQAIALGGQAVDPQVYAQRSAWQRMLDGGAYLLMRLAILLAARRY
jgi:cardiolipin synthase